MGAVMDASSADVFVSWLPLYHDMGLIGAWLGCLYFGAPLYVMSPLSFLARPESWLWAIHRYRATLSAAPNFAFELCLDKIDDADLAGLDLSSLRMVANGAEPVSVHTMRRFIERFGRYGFRARGDGAGLWPRRERRRPGLSAAGPRPAHRPGRSRSAEPRRRGGAGDAGRRRAAGVRRLRAALAGPRDPHRRRGRARSSASGARAGSNSAALRRPRAISATRRRPRRCSTSGWLDSGDRAYMAEATSSSPAASRTSSSAPAAHLSAGNRGSRRRDSGRPQGRRGGLRRRPTRSSAPSN